MRKKLFSPEIIIWLIIACVWLYFVFFHCFDDDEFQHCHNAYLMWQGLIPYRDFFEHHLPLYHIIFSSLFVFGAKPSSIFLFRIVSMFASGGIFFLLYKHLKKNYGKAIAIFCTVLLAFVPMYLYKMTEARPEVIAVLLYTTIIISVFSKETDKKTSFFIGVLSGLMVCFSQKYFFLFLGIFSAWFILKGKKSSLIFSIGFLISFLPLFLYLLMRGILPEFISSTIVLNLKWKYKFSPSGYLYEAFITAGFLIACGISGILSEFFISVDRKKALGVLCLVAGSFAGIMLVPVPYRQTYLPLFVILTISSGSFLTNIAGVIKRQRLKIITSIVVIFCAVSNATVKIYGELNQTNVADLLTMEKADNLSPGTKFFDGRGFLFYRMHTGYYGFMHHELLQMIDIENYSSQTIEAIKNAGFPVVIYDYRVKEMPSMIQNFIKKHYCRVGISDIYVPGVMIDRAEFVSSKKEFEIFVSGFYRISWSGGNLLLDGRQIEADSIQFLKAGSHIFETSEFVDNLFVMLEKRK